MFRSLMVLALAGLLILPAVATAQPQAGDWEFTLSGTGTNDEDWDRGDFSINGSLGYFMTDQFEGQIRQSVSYDDDGMGTDWSGSTFAALDYHFDLGNWQPFIGANIGYLYGDNVNDTWGAGLEGGLKWFVNKTTFVFFRAEWAWLFDDSDDAFDAFDDGRWQHTLGIGFLF